MVLGVMHLGSVETFRGHSPGPVQTNEVWQIFSENAQQAGAEADGEWFQATRGGLMGHWRGLFAAGRVLVRA